MTKNDKKYFCPDCGSETQYVGGLLDWECPNCQLEACEEYDGVNKEYYLEAARSYTYDEIYSDPEGNKPYCCKVCDGPYPSCLISCKIFDD